LTPTSPPKNGLDPAIELNVGVEKRNGSGKLSVDPDALQSFSASLGDQIQENGKVGKTEKKDKGMEEEVEKEEKRKEKGKGKRKEKKKSSSLERTMENGGSTDGPLPESTGTAREKSNVIEEQEQGYPPTPRSTTANSRNRESTSRSLVYSQLISSPPSSLVLDIIEKAAEKERLRVTDINGPYMLTDFIADPEFLQMLLEYLTFFEWSLLAGVSRTIRVLMVQTKDVREEVLEKFLRPVGYQRWSWEEIPEPLSLSLQVSLFFSR
jgi:hypothetical protein